jgi:geranylgeranyl pyrophosphate synthase
VSASDAPPPADPILDLPEIRAWPEAEAMLRRRSASTLPCWDLARASCAAFGALPDRAAAAVSAVRALLLSIHLVDDLLDADPRGAHHRLGVGVTANLALALQAAAIRVVSEGSYGDAAAAMQRSLAAAALATAHGQEIDARPLHDEADYFRAVDAKTPPLFVCALELGALAAGAPAYEAARVGALGRPLGRVVQVGDDLRDALERPARPDWRCRARNLAILYASTAPHEHRDHFVELLDRVDDPGVLAEAQTLLFRSGAVSYCVWHLVAAHRRGMEALEALRAPSPAPLEAALLAHIRPVIDLLQAAGVDAPERLLDAPDHAA